GYDIHPFEEKRALVLAGVKIEHKSGLKGHSDADAVAHAVTDALLGAAAMGDIGRLFPETDERWKDADSMRLLGEVRRRILAASYTIVNVDVTVITDTPKLAPYVDTMRDNLARVLGLHVNCVSVKAKTNENLPPVGRGKALQVFAVASLGGA
ncbi:MAG: 2-C-methyl-D-erythritol 2,4-cyclodiphosphate synthase, partial [Gemmatimonadales bacterium]